MSVFYVCRNSWVTHLTMRQRGFHKRKSNGLAVGIISIIRALLMRDRISRSEGQRPLLGNRKGTAAMGFRVDVMMNPGNCRINPTDELGIRFKDFSVVLSFVVLFENATSKSQIIIVLRVNVYRTPLHNMYIIYMRKIYITIYITIHMLLCKHTHISYA